MNTDPALVSMRGLTLGYAGGKSPILCDFRLEIGHGEIVGLSGGNGVGKTTLLRAISGQLEPLSGELDWCAGRRRRLTFSPQDDVILDYRTVWENAVLLLESPQAKSQALDEALAFARHTLTEVGLDEAKEAMPPVLSGGTRQRLQVVQAVIAQADLLLLDEPFSQQDRDHQQALETLIFSSCRAAGRASIIVSHDVSALAAICDRTLFLGGAPARIAAAVETPAELMANGGSNRRATSGFGHFSEQLWSERSRASVQ